ncbi:MAG: M6 family metalloprotease domain-containing protein [Muribaculaceae bacterium]|nr:M6 family metalloprotease domain-containing protein [Muribaculaceae bacterium]
MRRILTTALALLFAIGVAWAVPAKRIVKTVTQSDGKTLTITLVGDEFHHGFITTDGLVVDQGTDGNYYYRNASGLTSVMAHDVSQRGSVEASFVEQNRENMTIGATETARQKARRVSRPLKVGSTQVPTSGSPRVPIILVQYKDKAMKNTKSSFETHYKTGSKSVYQYFADQSNGIYTPQYDVYGIYTLDSNRATYGGNDSNGDDKGVAKMVGEAIDKAGNDIDWSQYDNDGDGEADVCIVVYAGVGEAQAYGVVPNAVWPCQWSLSSGATYNDGTGARNRNGVKIDRFAVFNEIAGNNDNGSTMDGIGTFCHEFSHCLGLPDFYETTYSHGYYGMGYWSLMNSGCYNGGSVDGDTPIGYSAYEKNFMGWIDYITPVEGTKYTLPVFNSKTAANDQAVKITGLNSNEYWILENRRQQGWDQYIADEGVLITHFTYVASRWEANTVNNYAVQCATIIPADNTLSEDNESTDLYGETKHEFSASSTPAMKANMSASGSLASSTGGAGTVNKPVTEITLNNDNTASFWYMKGAAPAVATPSLADASNVGTTSFTASWTDDTNTDVTYTLQVDKAAQLLLEETFPTTVFDKEASTNIANSLNNFMENSGWTGSTLYKMAGGIRLGSGSSTGTLTTPTLNYGDATKLTIVFEAAAYNNDTDCAITVGGTSLTIPDNTVDTYTVVIDATNKVTFATTAKSKRVVLSNIQIYVGDADSRTITGITAKNYTVENLTQGETYTFKVKAVSTDGESNWSTVKTVTLASGPAVPELVAIEDAIDFGMIYAGETTTNYIGILGANLEGDVTLTLNDANNVFSLANSTVSMADAEEGAEVEVTFFPQIVGEYTATVTLSSANAEDVVVTLTGIASQAPIILDAPVLEDASNITPSSFKATWSAVDNAESYTLEVNKKANVALLLEEDMGDGSTTWTLGGYTTGEDDGIRLGSSTRTGSVTSPALSFDADTYNKITVVVNARTYVGNSTDTNCNLVISYDGSSETIVVPDGSFNEYTVYLDATESGKSVTLETTAARKRVVVSSVQVYAGEYVPEAQAPARASEIGDETSRVITGITDTNYTVTGLEEYGTFEFKVMAENGEYTSDYSNVKEVTLEGEIIPVVVPVLNDASDITTTSFTASWTGDDNAESYTLEVNKKAEASDAVLLLEETFPTSKFDSEGTTDIGSSLDDYMDNAGWTGSTLYKMEAGLRIGKSRGTGYLVSPSLTLDGANKVTVVFDLHAYNNDTECGLDISCGDMTETITVAENATESHSFTFDATDGDSIIFANKANGKRVVLTNIKIYAGEYVPEAQAPARASETGDATTRTITGITSTSYTVENLEPKGTFEFKVKAVYADGRESDFSDVKEVSLASGGLMGDLNEDGLVNVTDVTLMVSYIMNRYPAINLANADFDGDGEITATDLTNLIMLLI